MSAEQGSSFSHSVLSPGHSVLDFMILGIDTATSAASAALVERGGLVAEEVHLDVSPCGSSLSGRANHATTLLPLVERLLKRADTSLDKISALALAIGPGSFTGLRIGLSTVKGLAYGWKIPVVGVPTLQALAARVTDWEGFICPFLDARKREVYAALFAKHSQSLERITPDLVSSPERMIERILSLGREEPALFIGDGTRAYGDTTGHLLGDRAVLTLGERYPSTASAVARLAEERVQRGEVDPLGPLVPLYLRPSEAELTLIRR